MTISHILSLNVNHHGHFNRNSLRTSDDQGIVAGVIFIMFDDAGYNIQLSTLCYQLQQETLSMVAEGIAK